MFGPAVEAFAVSGFQLAVRLSAVSAETTTIIRVEKPAVFDYSVVVPSTSFATSGGTSSWSSFGVALCFGVGLASLGVSLGTFGC